MRPLLRILGHMLREERRALLRGALLSTLVLVMGAALLGLSGWFIVAAAAAGLAGAGQVFDVFRPSAMVRFLALGRTGARYGERLTTHDATLRAIARLRVRLLDGLGAQGWEQLIRLRGAEAINRITADVDALDGVPLRLALPLLAGGAVHALAFPVIWWLVDLRVALVIALGSLGGAAAVLFFGAWAAWAPSRRLEGAAQVFRTQMIDLVGARGDLAVYGQLARQGGAAAAAEARRHAAAQRLDRIERQAGAALGLVGAAVAAAALAIGGGLAAEGAITPARAAIGFFAALALFEAIAPLRRTLSELGRMQQAAARVSERLKPVPARVVAEGSAPAGVLEMHDVSFTRPGSARAVLCGVSLRVVPGERVALAGPSGSGKSTILLLAAGLLRPDSGTVTLDGTALDKIGEARLRGAVTLLTQRASLLMGSVSENLRLADPGADEAALWRALKAAGLDKVIEARGGLETRLGPRGAGLSGGEARRLLLARTILRRPSVLLLDEPTEGLDSERAATVLAGLDVALPEAAIVMAAHRAEELDFAGRVLRMGGDINADQQVS